MLKPLIPDFLMNLLAFISKYKILGFIPLNACLHLIISTFITIILIRNKCSIKKAFIIIFSLGFLKEAFDSMALGNTITKHITDMFINLTYPSLIFFIHYVKEKSRNNIKNQKKEPLQ